jgi:sporulation protein YlmC with PRC-barrel domain
MPHYGILRDHKFEGVDDLRGADVYGVNDEKLGTIDDVIFDHSSGDIRYVVVDTGGWLSSKKFIVPAEGIRASAKHENDFQVDLAKKQIESFPPYHESDLESENQWKVYESRYRAKWVTSPVMHRAETDRNLTPTAEQESGNLSSERAAAAAHGGVSVSASRPGSLTQADLDAASAPTERVVPAGSDSVVISSNAVGIGGRWDTFQSRLRERRKQAVATCRTCAGESAVKRGSESVENLRKAG